MSLMIVCGFTNFVYAEEYNVLVDEQLQIIETKNEFERYEELNSYSIEELLDIGLTKNEAEKIKNTSFEDLVLERASLPEEILHNMGYSNKEIQILKMYDGSKLTKDSEIVTKALEDDCKGYITKVSSSGSGNNRKITFKYTWSWAKCPLVTSGDVASVLWRAYDVNGNHKVSEVESSSAKVNYRDFKTGAEVTKTKNTYTDYADTAYAVLVGTEFNFRIDHNSTGGKWAKSGEIKVTVKPEGIYTLSGLDVSGANGHSTFGIDAAAEISLDGPSISFMPKPHVTERGKRSARVKF